MLPAAIQVCPIELPGRGRRRDEPPVNDVAVLADQLAEALPLQVITTRRHTMDLSACVSTAAKRRPSTESRGCCPCRQENLRRQRMLQVTNRMSASDTNLFDAAPDATVRQ